MSVKIKKLEPSDYELAKLLSLFFQVDDGVENPTTVSDEYMRKLLGKKGFHVLVAIEAENVVGGLTAYEFIKYKREEREMFLYEIGVEASARRKGVGSKLIESLKTICKEKGITVLFVATEIDNEPAKKLYERTGGVYEETAIYTYKFD